ncbi:winged helix-turn-helix domain-containing protein [Luedemannella helvata]|uniref:OmpR/PhoB-type domain-containing protein n=1 Tax=Luedemannella helvata TaxID=349315 RepID=A0ABP4X9E6_9ACTN
MTVTVLRTHTPRNVRPLGRPAPRTTRHRRADPPAEVTLTIGVTLAGDRPHRDALDFIDGLNQLAENLGASVTIASAPPARPAVFRTPAPADIEIDPRSRVVRRRGAPVQLTKVEYDLLTFLVDNPRQVFTRGQLLRRIWGDDRAGRRTVDVHISRLRAKLGGELVATTRGVGYRLADSAPVSVIHHANGVVHE